MPIFRNRAYAAFLFDMDGTMLLSTGVIERVWSEWARRHSLNPGEIVANCHGVRAADLVRRYGPPGIDIDAETRMLVDAEMVEAEGTTAIDGIAEFVGQLSRSSWAVVTSAPRELAVHRIRTIGLLPPNILIAAEDVKRGKPDPEGFLKAASLLGVDIRQCLIFEDSHAGVAAAKAAGGHVVVVRNHALNLDGDYYITNYF